MCPFCLTAVTLVAASATSAAGMAVLATKAFRKKNEAKEISPNLSGRRNQDVYEHDGETEGSVAR
jgi:hypothetical protein